MGASDSSGHARRSLLQLELPSTPDEEQAFFHDHKSPVAVPPPPPSATAAAVIANFGGVVEDTKDGSVNATRTSSAAAVATAQRFFNLAGLGRECSK